MVDAWSRRVVGWPITAHLRTELVENALVMAVQQRHPEKVIHLSDQGSQYTALAFGKCYWEARVGHRPRLLSDNGPAYLSNALTKYIKHKDMEHVRGAPYHPMTQGKIERWHRTVKNVVKLENYYSPEDLKVAIAKFVKYHNQERYHE